MSACNVDCKLLGVPVRYRICASKGVNKDFFLQNQIRHQCHTGLIGQCQQRSRKRGCEWRCPVVCDHSFYS